MRAGEEVIALRTIRAEVFLISQKVQLSREEEIFNAHETIAF
jgi:hypothetical protein